jgi:hypothetical protein
MFYTICIVCIPSRSTCKFLSTLPLSLEISPTGSTTSPLSLTLNYDDVLQRPLELTRPVLTPLAHTHPSADTMMQCWTLAARLGFHLIFNLQEAGVQEDAALRDRRLVTVSRLMLDTLRDLTDQRLRQTSPALTRVLCGLLSTLGSVTVSHKLADQAVHIVRGGAYEEEVMVYLLTDSDLHVAPLPSLWDRPDTTPWPRTFTETLRSALCASFSLSTRSRLSALFNKKLSRRIPATDISFIEFAERRDRMTTLARAYQAVTAFFHALTHFVERYLSGMRKLKADLTSVIFSEDVTSGPMVSLSGGVLRIGLFKVRPCAV